MPFKKLLFLYLFIAGNLQVYSQFHPPIEISNTLHIPKQIQNADMNGDGFEDLVFIASEDSKIGYFPNDGLGNFDKQVIWSSQFKEMLCFAIADIDGDGDFDLIAANETTQSLWWLENDGSGQCLNIHPIASNLSSVRLLKCGDVDNDGDMDVVCTDQISGVLNLYPNNGSGNFETPVMLYSTAPTDMQLVDLDGDGWLDVTISQVVDQTLTLLHNSGMDFTFEETLMLTNEGWSFTEHCWYDFDNDGDLDVILSLFGGSIQFFENLGEEIFNTDDFYQLIGTGKGGFSLSDFDNDGNLDLAHASEWEDQLRVWYNVLNTDSEPVEYYNYPNTLNNSSRELILVDFNDDSLLDICSSSSFDGRIAWHENLGFGDFGEQQFVSDLTYGAYNIILTDFDADGSVDILGNSHWHWCGDSWCSINGNTFWYDNNPDSLFDKQQFFQEFHLDLSSYGDVDNDGLMDIVGLKNNEAYGPYSFVVLLNNSLGGLIENQFITSVDTFLIEKFELIDINNDSYLDLLFLEFGGQCIYYLNDGTGEFMDQNVYDFGVIHNHGLLGADLDNDSDLDLIVASDETNEILFVENHGDGTFEDPVVIANGEFYYASIEYADLNNDGLKDLVVSSWLFEHNLIWFENLGDLEFGEATVLFEDDLTGGVYKVKICDYDNQNGLDLFYITLSPYSFNYAFNDGEGNFEFEELPLPENYNPVSFDFYDYNEDGYQDLFLSMFSSGRINMYLNNFGGFCYSDLNQDGVLNNLDLEVITSNFGCEFNCAGDIDGDGDVDVFDVVYFNSFIDDLCP